MKKLTTLTLCALLVGLLAGGAAWAQTADDGQALTQTVGITQADVANAAQHPSLLNVMRTLGLLVFSTPLNNHDGRGDGPYIPGEGSPMDFGSRPTINGNGTVLRVNGLDAQSCNECHGFVSTTTQPPILGFAGVGGIATSAMPAPSLFDVADSFDGRVVYESGHDPDLPLTEDGIADYNGRLINPPFLYGGGGTELLGKEMTYDLQQLLAQAKAAPAGTVVSLDTHGVNFGYITSLGGGNVEVHPDGIGPKHWESLDPADLLVVRPFGRKGENFSMRDFDRGAMQFHFGMQAVERPEIGVGTDPDHDGVTDEVSVAEMSLLHVFDVTNPRPFQGFLSPSEYQGKQLFDTVGCTSCHRPDLKTRNRYLPLATPEVANDPTANVYAYIDLVRVGFTPAPGGGVYVPFYADLKHHKMGPRLAETCEACEVEGVANDEFTTARLWGIGDTAPYLHDGRATTLYQAIEYHGGEAQTARDNFMALSVNDQKKLISFLKELHTPRHPDEDIAP